MDTKYNPNQFEKEIYEKWEKGGYFKAKVNPDKKPYTIVMPPPNVTGYLHLGHALNNTIQDIIIRYKRMAGFEALWIPGTDHASISTESKVVDKIYSEGKTKADLGREGFLEEAWDWTNKYGGRIKEQLRTIGVSCDWDHDSFTMDENLTKAVKRVFKKMYDDGLIYRGNRIVNWDPKAETAISDAEVYHEDQVGHLWYIKYFFEDSDEYVTIATTRPETMLGDLAVAVNPEDPRFKDKIGKNLILPLVGRKIPLIEDSYVDMEYGTGLVKITPSHDPNDFEVGARHDLGQCVVIDTKARIVDGYGKYSGMDRYEARKEMIKDLEEAGQLEKIEEIEHAVGYSERTKVVIEPLISKQWFVKMDEFAKMCIDAYDKGEVKLIPDSLSKTYMNWLNNIRDWTISRQLWWGHRLPVFYTDDGEIIVSEDEPDENGMLNGVHVTQDEDTLDTWFSSALWPFATLGWPDENEELDYFFPTDILVTGYDIIFFWVIRMIFSSIYNTGKVPFHHVLFTGLIRDPQGRKMSKSLGNGVDPIDVVNEYGADALRFTLITGNSPGNDMRYDEKRILASRNFANKLWNASRFVLMNIEEGDDLDFKGENLELEDKWILKRLNDVIVDVSKNLDKYEIGLAADRIEDFIWNEYCDWYIEFAKIRLYGDDKEAKANVKKVLLYVLKNMLVLLHPFMPFITEEIYSSLPNKKDLLIVEDWPEFNKDFDFVNEESNVNSVIEAITSIRNQRATLNVPAKTLQQLTILVENKENISLIEEIKDQFVNLAKASEVEVLAKEDSEIADEEGIVRLVFNEFSVLMSLDELVDYEKERARLKDEIKRLEAEIKRASGKLSNKGFVEKAPEKVVNEEREKLAGYEDLLEKTKSSLEEIKDK
ncbi:Valine--tRNA ligase [Anaerococcus prevotii]|uniref:Valine--tRNA ligase n=1 Tax=Anaerococcus prevotii (strain ATCC 9321 / DSM 20548 / JCM 6508 / NCTC 11806 / PC1) TaxID=525919 RepID=C7RDK2_ANAPD|nr:valine--tRNA ligase [Anaerococcus prevotii]ACV29265.1 valyl-tRNA synthetase [Anaerococcus prevotii DSM 20548]SUU94940.1 Valine--tRNA ligase [Anaerococcus prevotii]